MPIGRGSDFADQISKRLAAIYQEAERQIAVKIAERLANGIELEEWQLAKLRQLGSLRREVATLTDKLLTDAGGQLDSALQTAYAAGGAEAEAELLSSARHGATASSLTAAQAAGVATGLANVRTALPGNQAVQRLAARLQGQLGPLGPRVVRASVDIYQKAIVQASAAPGVLLGTQTRRQATQAALNTLWSNGITGFTDSAGRNWNVANYAEMATRTTVNQALIEGHLDRLNALGVDLVIVSDAPLNCEKCGRWEGKVLTRNGPAYPHTVTVPSELDDSPTVVSVAGSVDEAISSGLMHPHCRHSLSAYLPGVTEPYEATDDKVGYAASQRQRELERRIRRDKLQAAGAVDEVAKARYLARVKTTEAELAEHVKANRSLGLRRKPEREAIDFGHTRPPAPRPTAALEDATKIAETAAKADRLAVLTQAERTQLADYVSAGPASELRMREAIARQDRYDLRRNLTDIAYQVESDIYNAPNTAVVLERLRIQRLTVAGRKLGDAPEIDELVTALRTRIEQHAGELDDVLLRDVQDLLDAQLARYGLERIGYAGDVMAFDRKTMQAIGGEGRTVTIGQPGVRYRDPFPDAVHAEGDGSIVLEKAKVYDANGAAVSVRAAAELSQAAGAARVDIIEPVNIERALASGIKERKPLGMGMQSDTFLVTTNDGTQLVRKNVRRIADELRDEVVGTSADAEVLAARIADVLGIRAPRTVRAVEDGADGLWLEYLGGDVEAFRYADDAEAALAASAEGRRMGLLDVLIANTDRNPGNFLVTDGRIVGVIDHGMAWQADDIAVGAAPRYVYNSYTAHYLKLNASGDAVWLEGHDFPRAELESIYASFRELRDEFRAAHHLTWFEETAARFEQLIQNARG